ncbi:MAG TPA: M23 family metallopeptidase [Candidatus Bilamarchaeum sp.]|nr:M23 family metallopeptidase [Candidatus Bilamarchaeum sp.]
MEQRAEKSRFIETRSQLLIQASALELAMISQNLPQQLGDAGRRLIRIVDDYFGVRDVRGLQAALNARGARGAQGGLLRESGRLDRETAYALFSYLHRAQELPNERQSVSQMLTEIRAVIYPHMREGGLEEMWSGVYATAASGGLQGLRAFLFAAGYSDFRNRDIGTGERAGAPELFALLSYAGGLSPQQSRDIAAGRPMSVASSDIVPARIAPERILFPVEPRDRRVEWHRGSYGSHSWRSGTVHRAIDIFAPEGYSVVAPAGGTVVHVGTNPSSPGGNVVIIRGADGVMYLFSHLASISVSEGQEVARGLRIGTVGSTGVGLDGTAVQASHLHFEVFRGDIIRREGRVRLRRRVSYNPADFFE